MANAEYSENKDRKYLVKGKHGLSKNSISKAGSTPAVKMKYPGIPAKFRFIKPSGK